MIDTVVKNAWQWRWRLSAANTTPSKLYVVLPTLRAIARAILLDQQQQQQLQQQHKNSNVLLTLTEFRQRYAHHFVNEIELTEEDMNLLLRYLHSQHGVAIVDNVKGYNATYTVIKFPEGDAIAASFNKFKPAVITQHDEAIISIRTTCHALSVQVDALQKKSEELSKQAILEKNLGHKSKALYCLRRKNNLQEILDRRLHSMETMDNVLMKIEQAKDDLQIVQALNMGADTLKGLLGKDGLSVVSIDEVMSKIQDTLDDQKEIEVIMQSGMDNINDNLMADLDEEDVQDELSDLIRQEEKEYLNPTQTTIPTLQQKQQAYAISSPSSISTLPSTLSTSIPSKQQQQPSPEESELARLNNLFSSMKTPKHNTSNGKDDNKKSKDREPILA
ncbi:Snf7-domain-containing protein [Mycotypha africana]|uniref:Snf7-domain-containing protein n=1 Tax=Mycotypha africana TaxID=64632 RepID=UPI002300FD4E|nr:Snf7-domain-containing protein [Mycotypha africana]KAI8984663.1 Snf7-domain-containing protein [Mycotypha africana]